MLNNKIALKLLISPPVLVNNFCNSKTIFSMVKGSLLEFQEYGAECSHSDLVKMLVFEDRYCSLEPKVASGWYLANNEVIPFENDGWTPVLLLNAILAIALHEKFMRGGAPSCMKMILQSTF